jgi:hypothetical protein
MLLQIRERTMSGIVCMLFLLLASCVPGQAELPKGVNNEFFWMSPKQQDAEFQKYAFEDQYNIYIYGCQQIEPPTLGLAWQFATEGRKIVEPLEAKLKRTSDDLTIRDIVRVFRAMNDLGTYDVAEDKTLMEQLREKVSAMQDPTWRVMTENTLQEIREKASKT